MTSGKPNARRRDVLVGGVLESWCKKKGQGAGFISGNLSLQQTLRAIVMQEIPFLICMSFNELHQRYQKNHAKTQKKAHKSVPIHAMQLMNVIPNLRFLNAIYIQHMNAYKIIFKPSHPSSTFSSLNFSPFPYLAILTLPPPTNNQTPYIVLPLPPSLPHLRKITKLKLQRS